MATDSIVKEIIRLLKENHDEILKDHQLRGCCGNPVEMMLVYKTPAAYKISQLLKELKETT